MPLFFGESRRFDLNVDLDIYDSSRFGSGMAYARTLSLVAKSIGTLVT